MSILDEVFDELRKIIKQPTEWEKGTDPKFIEGYNRGMTDVLSWIDILESKT